MLDDIDKEKLYKSWITAFSLKLRKVLNNFE